METRIITDKLDLLFTVARQTGFITDILDCTAFTVARETGLINDILDCTAFNVARETGFITDILNCAFYCSEGDRIYY
jgi:hypothetical protein